jgi:predicted ATPase
VPPAATYTFKHALVQEAAYQSLLKSRRQRYHQQIARAMVEQFPEEVEARPEFVAHHYTQGELPIEGVEYWKRAGQRAVQRSAHAEAIAHFEHALRLLAGIPASAHRDQQEVALQMALGWALVPASGWGGAKVQLAFENAYRLTHRAGDVPSELQVLSGLWVVNAVRGQISLAHDLAERRLALAREADDNDQIVWWCCLLGQTLLRLGDLELARVHLEESLARYDAARDTWHLHAFGQDTATVCRPFLASTLSALGYQDQALRLNQENLRHARALGHEFSIAWATGNVLSSHAARQEWKAVLSRAEEHVARCLTHGFASFLHSARVSLGAALAHEGRPDEGIATMREAIAALRAAGSWDFTPSNVAQLAAGYLVAGRFDEGLAAVDEALAFIERSGFQFGESELLRLKGELLLRQDPGSDGETEACFQRAIEIARRQQARTFELRAATSLARLWHTRGKCSEARDLLSPVYAWFTEGFDTPDLKEAKALLDELS